MVSLPSGEAGRPGGRPSCLGQLPEAPRCPTSQNNRPAALGVCSSSPVCLEGFRPFHRRNSDYLRIQIIQIIFVKHKEERRQNQAPGSLWEGQAALEPRPRPSSQEAADRPAGPACAARGQASSPRAGLGEYVSSDIGTQTLSLPASVQTFFRNL